MSKRGSKDPTSYRLEELNDGIKTTIFLSHVIIKKLSEYTRSQCAEEKSNESVEDMDGTFAGWYSMV